MSTFSLTIFFAHGVCSWYLRSSALRRVVSVITSTTTSVPSASVHSLGTSTSCWLDDPTAPRVFIPSTPTTAALADESSPSNSVTWYTQTGSGTTAVSGVRVAVASWWDTLAYWSLTAASSAAARTAPISNEINYFRCTTYVILMTWQNVKRSRYRYRLNSGRWISNSGSNYQPIGFGKSAGRPQSKRCPLSKIIM